MEISSKHSDVCTILQKKDTLVIHRIKLLDLQNKRLV